MFLRHNSPHQLRLKRVARSIGHFRFVLLFCVICVGPSFVGSGLADVASIEGMAKSAIKKHPNIRQVMPDELSEQLHLGQIVLVDVRSEKEMNVSMLPQAISWNEFNAQSEQYRDSLVVTYCTIGARSTSAAHRLSRKNFETANLYGGILLWIARGNMLQKNHQPTKQVHVYGSLWDVVPEGYEAIY